MNSRPLKIVVRNGNEHQAMLEDMCDPELYFRDVYRQGKGILEDIVLANECQDGERLSIGVRKKEPLRIKNILTICADRGFGKTSALRSFLRGILDMGLDKHQSYWRGSHALKYHYHILDTVDPTSMEKDDSLIKMVLTRMFTAFNEECKKSRDRSSDQERAELEQLFLRSFYYAQVLHSGAKSEVGDLEDVYDDIMEKGDGAAMRSRLYSLIKRFLYFVHPSPEESFLIIPIDDADLNTERVYDLLEEARRYLMLPQVIIVMAANIQQLECTVEQHYIKMFENSLNHPGSMVNVEYCHTVAERYLQKCIPANHRVYLPDINKTVQENFMSLRLEYIGKEDGQEVNLLLDKAAREDEAARERQGLSKWNYQEQLLYFLHRKTGMLFAAPDMYLHNFLPNSMRDLMQFLAYFGAMPDVECNYNKLITACCTLPIDRSLFAGWLKNLELTLSYLSESWAASMLNLPARQLLYELIKQPEDKKYSFLLKRLPEYYSNQQVEYAVRNNHALRDKNDYYELFINTCEKRAVHIKDIIEDQMDERATYADMSTALIILNDLTDGGLHYKLSYALHLYFSIHLHQLLLHRLGDKDFEYGISNAIRDGLFREYPVNEVNAPAGFLRVEIPSEKWEGVTISNQKDQSVANHFLRKANAGRATTLPYDSPDSETYIFNLLYPFLYEMDLLTSYVCEERLPEDYQKTDNVRGLMLLSIGIILNWDVQYELLHAIRKITVGRDGDWHAMLRKFYDNEQMRKFLKKIEQQNLFSMDGIKLNLDTESGPYVLSDLQNAFVACGKEGGRVNLPTLVLTLHPAFAEINLKRHISNIEALKSLSSAMATYAMQSPYMPEIINSGPVYTDEKDPLDGIINNLETSLNIANELKAIEKSYIVPKKYNRFSKALDRAWRRLELLKRQGMVAQVELEWRYEEVEKAVQGIVLDFINPYEAYASAIFQEKKPVEEKGEKQTAQINQPVPFETSLAEKVMDKLVEAWVTMMQAKVTEYCEAFVSGAANAQNAVPAVPTGAAGAQAPKAAPEHPHDEP